MNVLIVEDNKERIKEFLLRLKEANVTKENGDNIYICQTVDKTIKLLKKLHKEKRSSFDLIFMDHDLSEDIIYGSPFESLKPQYKKNTGNRLLELITQNNLWALVLNHNSNNKLFIIHSYNALGADEMLRQCARQFCRAYYVPEIWKKENFHKYIILHTETVRTLEFCTENTYRNYMNKLYETRYKTSSQSKKS